jgi:peptidoglycan/xylan/chitin deacetylase (PgdA/CDA1 family)
MAKVIALGAVHKLPLNRWDRTRGFKFLLTIALFSAFAARAQTPKSPLPQQALAITFDDLPAHGVHPQDITRMQIIQSILATLHREKLPPTYGFMNGGRTKESSETLGVLRAWRAAGQPLANHTWSHPSLNEISTPKFITDIEDNEPLLRSLMPDPSDDWRWFRYPYLNEGDTLVKHRAVRTWLKANHYQVAEVTMDFEDYLWNEPYTRCYAKHDTAALQQLHDTYLSAADQYITYYRALSKTVYGREIPLILLMHVGAFDAHMLPELLTLYRTRGFTFVTLPQAAADSVYAEDSDIAYANGDTLTEQLAFKRGIPRPHHQGKPIALLQSLCR